MERLLDETNRIEYKQELTDDLERQDKVYFLDGKIHDRHLQALVLRSCFHA